MDDKKEIECPHCKHKWKTKSKLKLVTCPSCNLKVTNQSECFKSCKEVV